MRGFDDRGGAFQSRNGDRDFLQEQRLYGRHQSGMGF